MRRVRRLSIAPEHARRRGASPARRALRGGRGLPIASLRKRTPVARLAAGQRAAREETDVANEKMTIYEVLSDEHRQTMELLDQLEASSAAAEREQLFTTVQAAIEAHADVEAATFYEALYAYDELEEQLEEAESEHDEVARILTAMEGMKSNRDGFRRQLLQLREALERHVQREEEIVFVQAQELLGDDEAMDLAQRYLEQKKEYLG
jgi:hypothetical protein